MKKIRVLDFFAGIGAFDCALDRLGINYELVDAVEIDKFAIQSFNAIHGTNFEPQDITKWDKNVGEIDLMWQSSPCQDISLAGKQRGADKGSNTRSGLVWEVLRIVEKVNPKILFWENVKGLTTKRHRHILDEYIADLERLGYNSYWRVLNSKGFGAPQNRERCFVVSIRKDIDDGYEFPDPIPLVKRLKDVLEPRVDEKYYLSDERIAKIKLWDARQRENGNGFRFQTKTGDDRPAETTYVEEKPVRLGGMYDKDGERHQAGGIFDNRGVSPTLDTCSGGNRMPYINEPSLDFVGGLGETDRVGDDKHLSRNYPQGNRVYSTDGLASAQTANGGGLGGNTGLYLEEPYVVASRGRGEKGNTSQQLEPRADGASNTITSVQKDNYVTEPQRTPRNGQKIIEPNLRIRRLTALECWRLQGFDDSAHHKAEQAGVSNSQRYKQAGNSVTVNVICALLSQLGLTAKKWNDMTIEERILLVEPNE